MTRLPAQAFVAATTFSPEEYRAQEPPPTFEKLSADLAHFKAPKHVVHMEEGLPKTSTGKVQKFELRKVAKDMAAEEGSFKAEVAKLNQIISEAEAERLKQQKEFEIVVSERDILARS